MEAFIIKALQLILSLSILIFVHELGHYFFARVFGTKVDQFYLFFNPKFKILRYRPFAKKNKLAFFCRNNTPEEDEKINSDFINSGTKKATWRDTEYGLGWLPLGGYCAINGMIDENMNTNNLDQPAQPWEFRSKKIFPRFLIMVGGVLFNMLAAMAIYAGIVYVTGEQYITFRDAYEGMEYSERMHSVGFQDGDIPLFADGKELNAYSDAIKVITAHNVTVLRNKKDTVVINMPEKFIYEVNEDAENSELFMIYRLPVVISQTQPGMGAVKAGLQEGDHILSVGGVSTPGYSIFKEQLEKHKGETTAISFERNGKEQTAQVEIDGAGKIGILLTEITKVYKTTSINYSLLASIPRGIKIGVDKLCTYVESLKYLFTAEGAQSLGGFGSIGNIFPTKFNWLDFWSMTAFLSVILAFMNILPIPALDGGHILFIIIEFVTRRKPSTQVLIVSQSIGMAILFALLIYANGNDIYRFLIK